MEVGLRLGSAYHNAECMNTNGLKIDKGVWYE